MTWSNGLNTIICEECGHEALPEFFTWYDGELPICIDKEACAKRKHYDELKRQTIQGETTVSETSLNPDVFLERVRQYKLEGRSERNIASEFGVSVTQLRSTIALAKLKMRDDVKDVDVPPPFPVIELVDKNPNRYIDKARELVVEHYNQHYMDVGSEIHISEVYVVGFDKVLQNWKALVATEIPDDDMYFEVTHDGTANQTQVDAYKKISHVSIKTVSYSRFGRAEEPKGENA